MSVKCTVIIVTYNAVSIIGDCLESLWSDHASGLTKVVVVDNASTDGTVEYVENKYTWATVVRNKENGGFGAGNNLGVQHAERSFCFILNPDSVVLPNCITELVSYLERNSSVGCVGPEILDDQRKPVISHYRFTDLTLSLWTAFGFQRFFPLNRTDGHYEVRRTPVNGTVKVDRLIGAAMMIRREILDQLGGFDERFFLYSEEEDLCQRMSQAGWKIVYHPAGSVVHSGAGTTGVDNPLAIASANWSRHLYMRKHCSPISAEVSRWGWICALLVRYVFSRGKKREGYRLSLNCLTDSTYFETKLRPKRL